MLEIQGEMEKAMATTPVLAWKTPWPEEPGGLQPMGSQSRTRLSDFTSLHLTGRKVSECLETKDTDICTFETSKIM